MEINPSIEVYNFLSRPPKEVLKTISGGRLRGMTDIKPQWRIKVITEAFGLCGFGWSYEIEKLWTESGADGEKMCFAMVRLFINDGSKTSAPIPAIGGSKLVSKESGGFFSNDEAYKMAVTDALSVAMKMIGVAADIYMGSWNGTKYTDEIS